MRNIHDLKGSILYIYSVQYVNIFVCVVRPELYILKRIKIPFRIKSHKSL